MRPATILTNTRPRVDRKGEIYPTLPRVQDDLRARQLPSPAAGGDRYQADVKLLNEVLDSEEPVLRA